MKARRSVSVFVLIMLLFVPLTLMGSGSKVEEGSGSSSEMMFGEAKYVFLFVGDGMGMPQINAAEAYLKAVEGSEVGIKPLVLSSFPAQGLTTTHAADRYITGSAASATALATGYKTNIGVIAMDPGKTRSYKTIAEMAKDMGMKVGILSSVSIDHATPAAFYAHQPSRSMYYEIDVDLANSGFDFFGGGGLKRPTGKNKDQPSALEMAKKNGYTIVDNRSDFMALRPGAGKVLAYNQVLDGSRALPYELDRAYNDVSIAEYTAKAIELLDNKKGFFIMVEGGKIDWACHANDAAASIRDTIAFDEAIAEAVDFYKEHPDDTLIVVTGDHECGGLTLGFAGTKYKTAFHLLKMQKKSATDYFAGVVLEEYKKSHTAANARLEDLAEEIRENFGLVYLSSAERDRLKQRAEAGDQAAALELEMALSDYEIEQVQEAFMESMREEKERSQNEETYLLYGGYEPLAVTLSHILNNKAGMAWTSYKHTGVPVPTFAMGVGQDMFNGYYDNTDVAKKMMKVMNVPQAVAAK